MGDDLASWSDIPFELVEQIIALCDNYTLLALAQTNHQLNYLAIQTLLVRKGSTSDYPKGFYFESDDPSDIVIPAFNFALSEYHAPDFVYYFHPNPVLFREALCISRFLSRVVIDENLTLSFDNIDQRRGLNGFWRMEAASAKIWRVIFVKLLETALEKGCRHLTLYGGLNFQIYSPRKRKHGSGLPGVSRSPGLPDASSFALPLSHPRPLRVSHFHPTLRTLYQGLVKWVKGRVRSARAKVSRIGGSSPTSFRSSSSSSTYSLKFPEPELVDCPPDIETETSLPTLTMSPPSLTRLDLQSAMMLHPLFFQYTLDLIRANSGSLQHLVLDYIRTSASTWKKLLKSIALPKLESFTFKLYGQTVGEEILPGIVLEFLTRHPTVRELELEGLNPAAQYPQFDSTNLLPILESLEATPRTLSWLLQNPTAYPKLKRISHTYDYCLPGSKNGLYAIFDIGMVPLSKLITLTTSTRLVNVKFKFSTESGFVTFFLIRGFSFIAPTPSQVFRSVEKMSIFVHHNKKFVENFKELLPALEMFPNLKRLGFREVENAEDLKKKNLIDIIRGSCPLVEEVSIQEGDYELIEYSPNRLSHCYAPVKSLLK